MQSNNSKFKTPTNYLRAYIWTLVVVASFGLISAFVSLQTGLVVLLLSVAGWWTWLNPAQAFIFLIVVAPLLPMLKITQTIGAFTLIKDVLIITLFVRVFAAPLARKTLPYRRNFLFAPVAALGAWTFVEALRANSPVMGVLRAREIGLYALLYFVALYLPVGRTYWKKSLAWFAATAGVVVALGWYQWFFAGDSAVLRYDPVREIWIPRISSIMAHPSILGHYLLFAEALAIALFLSVSGKKSKFVAAAAGLIMLPTIYLTYSRAVWMGLAAAGGVIAAIHVFKLWRESGKLSLNWKQAGIGAAGVAMIAVLVLRFTSAGTFLRTAIDPTYGSNEERIIFMARLISPLSDAEAVYGLGLGDVLAQNFRQTDLTGFDVASGAARSVQAAKNMTLVDNQYIKTLIEMGVVGIVIYGWIFWRYLKAGLTAAWESNKEAGVVGIWSVGFLIAFVLQGLFIDVWDVFPTNGLFWTLAGILGAMSTAKLDRTGSEEY